MSAVSDAWRHAIRTACRDAAGAILAARGAAEGLEIVRKADGTMVSAADRAASSILGERLSALDPAIPVVCEEGAHDPGSAARFWLVDPLDGTREFLQGRDGFSINVALVEEARAVFGVIHFPVAGTCYWGGAGVGAWRDELPLHVRKREDATELRVLVSPGEIEIARRRCAGVRIAGLPLGVESVPGAIKFCLLASGAADFYPRNAKSCAWDAAAGHAILDAAGGAVYDRAWRTLGYRRTQNWYNGPFIAAAHSAADWRAVFPEW